MKKKKNNNIKSAIKGIALGILLGVLLALITACGSTPTKRNHGTNYTNNPHGDVFIRY